MSGLIEKHRAHIESLCKKYGVKRLELFGSQARGDFDESISDIDLLVLFDKRGESNKTPRYFELLKELESLFGRKVDLVDIDAASNPYFVGEALRHRIRLYAA